MKHFLVTALLLTACAMLVSLVYNRFPVSFLVENRNESGIARIEIAGRTITVSVADMPEERERGLGGREGLAPDEGMLFVFPEDGMYSFWMKDMHFAIDILWISYDGVIVDIRQNVSPDTSPATFTPRTEARYVVELPAGYSEEYNLRSGDIVRL